MGCTDRSLLAPLLGSSSRRSRRQSSRNYKNNNNDDIELKVDRKGFQRFDEDMGKNSSSSGGWSNLFRKISLLVWKNFLFRKRHYIVTILEIILPTLLAIVLAYAKAKTPAEFKQLSQGTNIPNVTVFKVVGENELVELVKLELIGYNERTIAFSPNNTVTNKIISQLDEALSMPKIEWKGFNTEVEIEAYNGQSGITDQKPLRAAIVFESGFETGDGNFPTGQTLSYKLRLADNHVDTNELFPAFQIPGPNIGTAKAYAEAGFSGLQVLIDKIIIGVVANEGLPTETISLQPFPYPPYLLNFEFATIYNLLMPLLLSIGFVFIVPSIVRGVVGEKETGIKELLKMYGLSNWMHWFGWMLNSMLVLIISITIVVFLFFFPFNKDNGGLVEHSDPTVWWVFLFLYAMSSTAFCFFISSFFAKPTLATTVGIIVWLVSYFALSHITDKHYTYMSLFEKLVLCLVPNMALKNGVQILAGFEGKAVGSHWSNLFESASSVDSLCLAHVFLMMFVSTFMYIFLSLYVENILPSQYGVRKPWYYIFKKSTWYSPRVSNTNSAISRFDGNENQPSFEADPPGLAPGVEIYNLRKTFGSSKVAVDDVTLKMFDGQITCLLGHNGAGKTTTMSMLTGMFAPTSGTAVVNGHDINTDLEGVRSDLGLCPQHNMLFDKLTVAEHLIFFGRLKGLTKAEANAEMKSLLKKLQLSDKTNVFSMALSGGMKRKLNLGMALIGGSKVVILDEPTSGMDPEARRSIWDLLLEMRGERTICLTTHFMEEADVLGDRIAIMAEGKVECCGSPMFLKRYYGAGYTLSMTVENNSRQDLILLTIKKYIENASFKSQHAPNSSEIAITLPTGKDTTSKFPGMFSDLSHNKEVFGIKTIGLALTTMDEVFIKVGQANHGHHEDEGDNGESVKVTPETERKNRSNADLYLNRLTGLKLASQQFYALLVKRYLYTLRKRKLFLSQLVMPVALLIVAILVTNGQYEPHNLSPPLKINIAAYNKPLVLYSTTDKELGDNYEKIVGTYGQKSEAEKIIDDLVSIGETDLAIYRERYIVGAEINRTGINALFSTIPYHASPLAINLATNAILQKHTNKGYKLEVTNHPLKSEISSILDAASANPIFTKTTPILFAVFLPLGLALLAASYIVFPIEERLCKAKQLQLMTGVNPMIFWGSSFVWDFMVMVILICVMITCFPIFQSYGVFTAYNGAGVLFLIFLVYGFTAISFSYLISLVVSTVPGGFSFVTILHVFSGMILCIIVYVLEMSGFFGQANFFRSFSRVFPTFGAAISVMQFTEKATMNSRCLILSKESKEILCKPSNTIPLEYRSCCDNCTGLFPGAPCFEPQPYILWSEVKHAQIDHHSADGAGSTVPGIGQELLYLFLLGLFFKVLLIIIEYGVVKRLLASVFKTDGSVFQKQAFDSDVQLEKQRVQGLLNTGSSYEDAIVVSNLCKSYGSFAAVSNMSFGVHHGECFGLLGVNGAGKTTTFRMLTGDEIRSDGNAFTSMCNLQKDRKRFLSSIGYCPQFDGIVGVLTGKEMLELFCRLRGVQTDQIHAEATKWLVKLGLIESGNVQCMKYSGGMKRRLSTAMALIGDPPVVLLDEPTSGVDPVSRRSFWRIISSVRDSGQAVILTSHSMEECEALCSRLAIMVNGQMQCLGGVQELKNKFAQGYSLVIKLKGLVPADSSEVATLSNDILEKFKPCNLKDQHQNILQFQVLNPSIPWDVLFKTMEDLKTSYENIIEDYSVNETTLEDIFLSFARMQYPERRADVPFLKKLITCQCCS